MIIREELDALYEKIWHGEIDNFRILLERFIPFARWGFSFVEKKNKGRLTRFVYRSPYIWLEISPDLEQYEGLGSVSFFYSRDQAPRDVEGCWPWIDSRESSLSFFLERIPVEATKSNPQPAARQAFERTRSSNEQLMQLRKSGFSSEPAYSAAFEGFCWEYYGERFFRLFYSDNQAERDALTQYLYDYYKVNYSPEAFKRREEDKSLPPPWKICL